MRPFNRIAVVLLIPWGLAACSKDEPPPPVRPVLSTVVALEQTKTLGFAGTVQPQFSTKRGFRVFGRIITRPVKVGDVVTKGTPLASLDPVALALAVKIAESDVASARAQLTNASGAENRKQTLSDKGVSTQSDFEAARQSRESASAAVIRAEASLSRAREQLGYAELVADSDGVITSVDAEVGQVVSDGQTVIQIARSDVREAVIDVPGWLPVVSGSTFAVALQIDPTSQAMGRVREIGPQADAITRTRRIRITLIDPPIAFRLGTTINATVTTAADPRLALPRSAVLEKDGATYVWVVDPAKKTVSLRPVSLAASAGEIVRVATGLVPGDRVVTAGANSLREGQAVTISDEAG